MDTSANVHTNLINTNLTLITANDGAIRTNTAAIAENTAKTGITSTEQTKLGHITVTKATDLDTMQSNVATNNDKVGITTEAQTFSGVKTFSDGIVTGKLTSPPGAAYKSWRLIYRMGTPLSGSGLYTMGIRFFDENGNQIVTGSTDDITANNGQNGAIQWFVSGNQPTPPSIFSTWSVCDCNIAAFIGAVPPLGQPERAYFIGLHFSEKQKVSRIEIHSKANKPRQLIRGPARRCSQTRRRL